MCSLDVVIRDMSVIRAVLNEYQENIPNFIEVFYKIPGEHQRQLDKPGVSVDNTAERQKKKKPKRVKLQPEQASFNQI